MCLVGELLWKRAAPKPLSLDQGFRFIDRSQVGSILLFLTPEMGVAGPGGERMVDHSVQGSALAFQPLIRSRRTGGQHHRFPRGVASGLGELHLFGAISPRSTAAALPDPVGGGLPSGCGR